MKYTVCYAFYCSRKIEAETADDAADIVASEVDPPDDTDDMEVTLVIDEHGNRIIY